MMTHATSTPFTAEINQSYNPVNKQWHKTTIDLPANHSWGGPAIVCSGGS